MVTYLFPGQGSQLQGMGGDLFDAFPELTRQADAILGYSIKELCISDPHQQLNQTQFTQPALYVVNALSYQQKLKQTGVVPDFVAGHSLGEYNALQSSGALSYIDGLQLVKKRGELMSCAPKGAMAAIIGSTEHQIRQILEENELTAIDIANLNAPAQTILSGLVQDIDQAQACFENKGLRFIPLNTSGAFHSRYMAAAQAEFAEYLKNFSFSELKIPVIANVDALPYRQEDIALNLANQITHSVRWSDSIQYLMQQGDMEFLELGVGNVLTRLVDAIKQQAPVKTAIDRTASDKPSNPVYDRENMIASLNAEINQWNKNHPIGTRVSVQAYEGVLETKSPALILFGHRAAIYLQGYNGYFALDEVKPL